MLNNLEKPNRRTLCFYIGSFIIILCGLLNVYNVHQYIRQLVDAKQLVISQQFLKVLNTYVESTIPYLFYASALFGIGYLISLSQKDSQYKEVVEPSVLKDKKASKSTHSDDDLDDDLDDFLNSL